MILYSNTLFHHLLLGLTTERSHTCDSELATPRLCSMRAREDMLRMHLQYYITRCFPRGICDLTTQYNSLVASPERRQS